MKGSRLSIPALLAVVIVLSTQSCSKIRQYIEQHPSDIGKYCRIDSFSVITDFGNPVPVRFSVTYDAADRPIKYGRADNVNLYAYYVSDYHFRYDHKGRLSDVQVTDPGGSYVYLWYRYTYPSARTIVDSIYEYGGSTTDSHPPYPATSPVRIIVIQLDGFGRPVHTYEHNTDPVITPSDNDIAYDQRGNLIVPGVQYDDKVNIYQTSSTWQLFFLDYSKNNPIAMAPSQQEESTQTPAAYNGYGLPTIFLGSAHNVFAPTFAQMNVYYSCDSKPTH